MLHVVATIPFDAPRFLLRVRETGDIDHLISANGSKVGRSSPLEGREREDHGSNLDSSRQPRLRRHRRRKGPGGACGGRGVGTAEHRRGTGSSPPSTLFAGKSNTGGRPQAFSGQSPTAA